MFSYKVAVALRKIGYQNIKIYNGGLKDWKKSGYTIKVTDPLPDVKTHFISAKELKNRLDKASALSCRTLTGNPMLTLLDFRTEMSVDSGHHPPQIQSDCHVIRLLLDDLLKPESMAAIPRSGLLVTITETGNRDQFVIRYLYKSGITNIKGLEFGMRSWIKKRFPVQQLQK